MKKKSSATRVWTDAMENMQKSLDEDFASLEEDYKRAKDDFDQRLKKAESDELRNRLKRSQAALECDMTLIRSLRKGCDKLISDADKKFIQEKKNLRDSMPDQENDEFREGCEMRQATAAAASVVPIVADTKALAYSLGIILKHKASKGIEKAAVKELLGAMSDPGKGVVTLVKRLRRVLARSIEGERTTDEVLTGLKGFEELLDQWVCMIQEMGKGKSYDQALREAFKKWIK